MSPSGAGAAAWSASTSDGEASGQDHDTGVDEQLLILKSMTTRYLVSYGRAPFPAWYSRKVSGAAGMVRGM